ncbi:MAG: rane fusion protein multidrug efflux system [Chloroflexota bacterium]|jgi:multidrug efflux system membrane fusion protein|nr:rane fusion protein multidrug efflux system [Chloroflexota bacterium]
MRTTRLRVPAAAGVMLALAGALAGCGSPSVRDAIVYKAGARTVSDHPGGAGTTAAGITIPVSVDFRDLVTDVGVRPGVQVRRGQPLISLDPTPFQAQAVQLNAKLQLLASQIDAATERMKLASAHGDSATATALAEQINSYQGAQAIVQQQIDIAQGRASQILSPIDGVIGNVSIQPGGYASPGQVLLTVLDLTHIQVSANLPIADRQAVKEGAAANISLTNLTGVGLQGRVVLIAAGADPNGQTFQVSIDAPNTPDQRVVPGLKAYVRLTVDHSSPVVISRSAVLNLDQDPTVYLVEGQVVHRQHVEIGVSDGTYVEVLQGLKAGDLVCVISSSQPLQEGDAIRIVQTQQG